MLDVDATLVTARSEKEGATPTYKRGFGFHPLLCFADLDGDGVGGDALAGILRSGRAGANDVTDHITVLDLALAQLPAHRRPRPGDRTGPSVLVRCDSAGGTYGFAAALPNGAASSPSASAWTSPSSRPFSRCRRRRGRRPRRRPA